MAKPLTSQITFKTDSYYSLLDIIYPIGTLYFSYSSTSPASLFGGTWSQLFDRFIRVANDVNTGGSDTHTLTVAQLPVHSHSISSSGAHTHTTDNKGSHNHSGIGLPISIYWSGDGGSAFALTNRSPTDRLQVSNYMNATGEHYHSISSSGNHTHTADNTGSSQSHNNMPAYQDVYCWRRTA